jgi:hypothetical protein
MQFTIKRREVIEGHEMKMTEGNAVRPVSYYIGVIIRDRIMGSK